MNRSLNLVARGRKTSPDAIAFTCSQFPGGELNFRLEVTNEPLPTHITIYHQIHNGDDLMLLLLACDALKRAYPGVPFTKSLVLWYVPYGRQDRVCNQGEAFGLKVIADLINGCNFSEVHILDPHSEVTPALIENAVVHTNEAIVLESVRIFLEREPNITRLGIVAPDAGAIKKIYKLVQTIIAHFSGIDVTLVTADKVRNLATGEIIRTEVHANVVPEHCLIIDDILDGGRTLIEVANVLKEKGAITVGTIISHGIFSKGTGVFRNKLEYIFTTNSFHEKFSLDPAEENMYSPNLEIDLGFPASNFFVF